MQEKNLSYWKGALIDTRKSREFWKEELANLRGRSFLKRILLFWWYDRIQAARIESEIQQFSNAGEFALRRIHDIELNTFLIGEIE